MFGELLSGYFGTFKLGIMTSLILVLLSLLGFQTLRLYWADYRIDDLAAQVMACKQEKAKLSIIIDTQAADINDIQAYYRGRKPMNAHDGELKPDEIKWHK